MATTNFSPYFVLLSAACFSGCGRSQEGPLERALSPTKAALATTLDEPHDGGHQKSQFKLSEANHQTLALLRQACAGIDLMKLKEISGSAITKVASPEEFTARILLCDQINTPQQHSSKSSASESLRRVQAYLNNTRGDAGAVEIITSLLEVAEKIEAPTSIVQPSESFTMESFDRALIDLLVKRARLDDELATAQGVVVDKDGTLLPVAATIIQPGARSSFIAHVVLYPTGKVIGALAHTNLGGFIQIDFKKVSSKNLNAILANEFAHQFLSREGIVRILESTKVDQLKPASPFPDLMAFLSKDLLAKARPTSSTDVLELYSDSWSTKADLLDVDRIISNGFYHAAIGALVKEQPHFSPEISKIVDKCFPVKSDYILSEEYAIFSLLSCYLRDGKQQEAAAQMERFANFGKKLTTLFSSLDKAVSEFNRSRKQKEAENSVNLGRRAMEQLAVCEAATKELAPLIRSSVKGIPNDYKDTIQKSLEHYANDYVEQAMSLSR